jgi:hypothetical protein
VVNVDLRWNEIGPGGAAAIVAMLQRTHCLTDVRLIGNGIPPSTQAQIDELLEKNRTCKLLEPAGPLLDGHALIESDIGLVRSLFAFSYQRYVNKLYDNVVTIFLH